MCVYVYELFDDLTFTSHSMTTRRRSRCIFFLFRFFFLPSLYSLSLTRASSYQKTNTRLLKRRTHMAASRVASLRRKKNIYIYRYVYKYMYVSIHTTIFPFFFFFNIFFFYFLYSLAQYQLLTCPMTNVNCADL